MEDEQPTLEQDEELQRYLDVIYQSAIDLSFQAWLQLMTPLWEKQAHEMRLQGWLSGQLRPEE